MKARVRVERDITEQAVIEFSIDQAEYEEWLDGQTGTDEDVLDFLMAHRDWPANVVAQIPTSTQWREQHRDYVLMVER